MGADRKLVLLLAAESEVDPRTARRALTRGLVAVRGWHVRHRLLRAAKTLGIVLDVAPAGVVISLVPRTGQP